MDARAFSNVDHMAALIGIRRPLSQAPHFSDPRHWRERAEETRVIAENMDEIGARQMMLRIADDYDRLAVRAMERIAAEYGRPS